MHCTDPETLTARKPHRCMSCGEPVNPGERITVVNRRTATASAVVKILGDGDAYSVVGSLR
jgi:hypothetical protein